MLPALARILQQQLERIGALPNFKQKFVMQVVGTVVQQSAR